MKPTARPDARAHTPTVALTLTLALAFSLALTIVPRPPPHRPAAQDKPAASPALTPGVEPRVVLTPKPGPAPRINGARVFGVRPGSPFLFTIPATGDRPMTFGVEGLPEGLTLDAATGQITGLDRRARQLQRHLHAPPTAAARPTRTFKIVCGDDAGPHAAHGLEQLVRLGEPRHRRRSCARPPTPWSRAAWPTTAIST